MVGNLGVSCFELCSNLYLGGLILSVNVINCVVKSLINNV